jgi:hypothetical protein
MDKKLNPLTSFFIKLAVCICFLSTFIFGSEIIGIDPLTIVFGKVSLILSLKAVTLPLRREFNDAAELELFIIFNVLLLIVVLLKSRSAGD